MAKDESLIQAQKDCQAKIRDTIEEINVLIVKVGYEGDANQSKNDLHIQEMQLQLQNFTAKIDSHEMELTEQTKLFNKVNMECEEQKTVLADTEQANANHKRRANDKEQQLQTIQDSLKTQEKALAEEIAKTEEEFKSNVTSQREIRAKFDTNIKTAQKKIVDLNMQQLVAIGQEHETTVQSMSVEQLRQLNTKSHFIFVVDESGSMNRRAGILGGLFSNEATMWEVLKQYLKDFLNTAAQNLSSNDRISCVGFSDKAYTRMENVTPAEASKFAKLWEPSSRSTYLTNALVSARQMANLTPNHRIVYVMLTDGHIMDHNDAVKQCTLISKETKLGVEKTLLISVGLGPNSDKSQLTDLVSAANGTLVYEFAGQKICDLM